MGTVAFLGPLGTYSHQVTSDFFGSSISLLPQERIRDVFEAVSSGAVQYGVVPIENSSIGPVLETMECLRTTTIPTRHMVGLKIGHALLGSKRIQLDQVQRVYSHEQGIGQCVGYIAKYYPSAEIVPCNSTAKAAQLAVEDAKGLAICSIKCAEVYGLDVIDTCIQDGGESNTTRFIIISSIPLSSEYPVSRISA